MIRWHRIKHRVAADAWFNRPGTGKIVVVDCGKGLPPQIDSLVDIVTDDDDGGRQETWRVRGIERSRNCTKVGLIVTKATEEEKAEAHGVGSPDWKSGSTGIPSDRDVWAYIHNHGTGDIELLRGRDDQGDFMPPARTGPTCTPVRWCAGSTPRSSRVSGSRPCVPASRPCSKTP
jgi:hypothetical protein